MVFPSPLCAIEVFAVGFIMIHQYVWLSFTIFSLFVGNFLEFFFWLTAPESCRIVESSTAEDFLCVVHWVAPRMFTIRTMAPANYENCPQSLLNALLWMYSSPWPLFANSNLPSELTTVQSIRHLLLREIVKNMSFTWVIEAMALGFLLPPWCPCGVFLVYLVSGALALSICGNLFEVNRHLWSHESPHFRNQWSRVTSKLATWTLWSFFFFKFLFFGRHSFKMSGKNLAKHGFMFLYLTWFLSYFIFHQ